MSLHRLASITIGVPEPEPVRAFYSDFGLTETKPGRFESADGGEQLRIETEPRRQLLALSIGVDDADDLGRVAAALGRLGVAAETGARSLRAVEPVTGVRVELAIEPRVVQKTPAPLPLNTPGDAVRIDARCSRRSAHAHAGSATSSSAHPTQPPRSASSPRASAFA